MIKFDIDLYTQWIDCYNLDLLSIGFYVEDNYKSFDIIILGFGIGFEVHII